MSDKDPSLYGLRCSERIKINGTEILSLKPRLEYPSVILKRLDFNTLATNTGSTTTNHLCISDSPRRCQPIHWLAGLTALVGVVMILISRAHYTVDVLLAYWITTWLWYMYHTLANNSHLKVNN